MRINSSSPSVSFAQGNQASSLNLHADQPFGKNVLVSLNGLEDRFHTVQVQTLETHSESHRSLHHAYYSSDDITVCVHRVVHVFMFAASPFVLDLLVHRLRN